MSIILFLINFCVITYLFINYIYLNNLLYFIDLLATSFAYILRIFKVRDKVMQYNLGLVFPNMDQDKKDLIKFRSCKLFLMNILIVLHQRFIIDTDYLMKYYDNINIPNDLKDDLKKNKVIFAVAHLGIYYDFSSCYKLISPLSCIYKMKYEFIEKFIYGSNKFKNKILPIKHDKLGELINNEYPSMCIPCDQKSNSKEIYFLKQKVKFHDSVTKIHKITKRSIWVCICYYDFNLRKIKMKLIPIERIYNSSNKNITQKIADIMTKEILENPDQYFWLHDRFNSNL
jgi:lauroyl/myristoyl acyltransferase